jgi:autotransporter-associated beta strand protein
MSVGGLLLIVNEIRAATYAWNLTTGGNWNTAANWNPNSGFPSLQDDVADFTTQDLAATNSAVSITAPVTVGSLTAGDIAGNQNYVLGTVTGSALTFSSTTGATAGKIGASTGADYIAAPIVLAGDVSVNNQGPSSSFFQFGSGNTAATGGTGFATVSGTGNIINNSSLGRFSITDRLTSSVGLVNNSTASLLYLNSGGGANSFSGGTTLNAGSFISLGGPAANTTPLGSGTVNLNGAALYTAVATKTLPNAINVAANTFNAVKGLTSSITLVLTGPIQGSGTLSTGNTSLTGGFGIPVVAGVSGSSVPNQSDTFFRGDISGFQGTFAHESVSTAASPSVANGMIFDGATLASMDGSQAKFSLSGLTSGATRAFSFGSTNAAATTMKMGELSGTGGIMNKTGSITNSLEIGHLGTSSSFAGVINGANLSVTKLGAGTLTLAGNNTYTGTTSVSAGKLLVNGTHSGNGPVTVAAGATLGGTGSLGTSAVTVDVGALLAPGASIESLSVGSVTGGGTLVVEYDGDAGVDAIDLLNVSGNLDITSMLVDFDALTDPLDDAAVVFATYGSLTGAAFLGDGGSTPAGYTINYAYNDGNSSNNIALVAVPESSSIVLVAIGITTFAASPKRRRR